MFVKVLILQSTFSNYDTTIIAIGNLHDIAKDNEIEAFKLDNINVNNNTNIDINE
jgi:hypothetical protein